MWLGLRLRFRRYNLATKKQPKLTIKAPDLSDLSAAELRLMVAQYQAVVEAQSTNLLEQNHRLENQNKELKEARRRIEILEEINRLLKAQKFSASSEKSKTQFNLFDETELEVLLDELLETLPETPDCNIQIAGRDVVCSGQIIVVVNSEWL